MIIVGAISYCLLVISYYTRYNNNIILCRGPRRICSANFSAALSIESHRFGQKQTIINTGTANICIIILTTEMCYKIFIIYLPNQCQYNM